MCDPQDDNQCSTVLHPGLHRKLKPRPCLIIRREDDIIFVVSFGYTTPEKNQKFILANQGLHPISIFHKKGNDSWVYIGEPAPVDIEFDSENMRPCHADWEYFGEYPISTQNLKNWNFHHNRLLRSPGASFGDSRTVAGGSGLGSTLDPRAAGFFPGQSRPRFGRSSAGRGDTSAQQYPHPQAQADLEHGRGYGAVNSQQSQGQYPFMPPGGYQAQYPSPGSGAYNQYPGSQYQNNASDPYNAAVAPMDRQQPYPYTPVSGPPSGQYDPRYMQQHPNASSSTGSMFVLPGPPPGSSMGYSQQQPPQASPFPPPGYWKT
ncbi:hypothetical protein B0H12DRAFT_1273116 [Mycena haematopus]|nr:hypothetical protein B0H12DRAFT_1273116 [Mycena haematopus]